LHLGLVLAGDWYTTPEMVRYAKIAEGKGFDSIWVAEHYYFRDAFSTLAAIAAETSRIKLGTGVINPYTRNPALIAMSAATVNELSGGRMILGIGTSLPLWIEQQMKIPMGKPLVSMRESVQIIRKTLTGDSVSYEGNVFKVRNIKLGFGTEFRKIPVYVAAVGPRMLQLGGELGDGVLLTAGNSISYVKQAVNNIKEGATRSGRDFSKIDVASLILSSVGDFFPEEEETAIKEAVATLLSRPGRAELMLGRDAPDIDKARCMREAVMKGDLRTAVRYVTDEMIDAVAIVGPVEECLAKLKHYVSSTGVTLPIVSPLKPTAFRTIEAFASLLG